MSFFVNTDSGVTMNRFSQDLQLIDMELPIAALNTFTSKCLFRCRFLAPYISSSDLTDVTQR